MTLNPGHWLRQRHVLCSVLIKQSRRHSVPIGTKGMAPPHSSPATNMMSSDRKMMLNITGKDAEVTLTETYIRLKFYQGMATGDKLSVSPRDLPLTSIAGVEMDRSGMFSGTFRLALVGDTATPRGASVDINTVLTPLRGRRAAEWEEFTIGVRAAIAAAEPKIPLSEQPLTAATPDIRLDDSTYLGGLPGTDPSRYPEALVASSTRIRIGSVAVAWADCSGVTIEGGDIAKSRVAATIMFGVAGLATKSSQRRVLVTVHKSDGTAAVFQVANAETQVVTATLEPLLRKLGVPFHSGQAAPGAPAGEASPIDLLERLGKLREFGVLTEEEFASKKAELLARL